MRQNISFITLGVGDLARSRAFYAALGWRESSSSQEAIAFFNAGTVVFGLFQREALAEDAQVSPVGSGFAGFTLAQNVESADSRRSVCCRRLWPRGRRWCGRPTRFFGAAIAAILPTLTAFFGRSAGTRFSRWMIRETSACRSN
jgi:catechol 2,3-dioxygenase-like lactoylglutathione lyase family enzyme